MVGSDTAPSGPLRLTELLASVSLATDLGTGQPPATRCGRARSPSASPRLWAAAPEEIRTAQQFALLRFLGCTADAAESAAAVGGDELAFNAAMAPAVMGSSRELLRPVRAQRRARPATAGAVRSRRAGARRPEGPGALARRRTARSAAMLAARAGPRRSRSSRRSRMPTSAGTARGSRGAPGDAIPLAVRIVVVARDADLAAGSAATRASGSRSGEAAYDPAVVDAFARVGRRRPRRARRRRRVGGGARVRARAGGHRAGRTGSTLRPGRLRRLRRPEVALDPRPLAPGRGARRPSRRPRRARRRPHATGCGTRASSTTSAAWPSRTGSGTSRAR